MDNRAIARILSETADLLEIKGENAFKIRAYRSAAETIAAWPSAVAGLGDQELRAIPGIGKDLAARVRELGTTGRSEFHQTLLQEFPPTILDLLHLQGIGPRTVALLHAALNVTSVEDLAAAAREGRLRTMKGMGAKKEALILAAIAERAKHTGRHLLSETAVAAAAIVDGLRRQHPEADLVPVGSFRRGTETCGDIDILAVGGDERILESFVALPQAERVLGHGETTSRIRLPTGFQAGLRLVPVENRGAAMQYFTGSTAHNIALRDRAGRMGLELNESGVFRLEDHHRLGGRTEEEIYAALGLPWIAPELREHRGEIEAALDGTLPALVERADLRGDLHMHTTATDGRDDLATMADAARRAGHQYIAITDHSKALAMANGLDEQRALEHAARVRALNGRYEGLTLLAGIECDILADGTLDLSPDCLAQLDIVVASIHSGFSQPPRQLTDRLLRALECPWVDVLGHPTARRLLKREPLDYDMSAVLDRAAQVGVAIEINCQVDRLDVNDVHARAARERGIPLVISTDAHSAAALARLQWGVLVARRAWATAADVLNAQPLETLRRRLRRHRAA